ncbi:TonB-linked outer membrane protein, SusC/RagA family [Catalinimonas alkaloidigena]|uniref:TonB-linked outer membrane protein, SusC/RagA family n=1 Tax=Catalinimonas alkaloidigena TaxID=1075417 RepID=A0A1G9NGB5_9BACT|nr:SusC/RagA family TonB-linked outer membrane protein [Catalinimonas alkaloidigena]SDL85618.1 TonB-linked outer membrane protein, SusC/RagA family [Catalinimonas alkaloidigena]
MQVSVLFHRTQRAASQRLLLFLLLVGTVLVPWTARAADPLVRTLTGTVTSAEDGTPLPGVTVLAQGTVTGTITDISGHYTLQVADDIDTLLFSYVGFATQHVAIAGRSTIDVALTEDAMQLSEVVVTALGIRKEKARVGYAVQEVDGSNLVKAREPNAVSTLTGRVAGLQVSNSPELFSAPTVTLRGKTPLIVVDGQPISSDFFNISPDDIETYTVLKGPTAAALYGSRGRDGAIQITTKRGAQDKNRGFSVDFNSSTTLQSGFNAIPDVQNQYGPGSYGQYAFGDGKGGGINDSDYDVWGPKLDGRLIPQYDSPIDPATGERIPTPFLPRGANNLTNFLQNGLLSTNNLSVATSSDKGDLRVSATQTYQRGIVPNTRLNITNFAVSGGMKFNEKLRLETNLNYNKQYTPNIPEVDYGPNSIIYNILIWNGADFDIRDLKNYWQPGKEGLQQVNNEYARYNNPWFSAYEWLRGFYKDDVFGFVRLSYDFNKHFSLAGRTYVTTNTLNKNEKFPYSATTYGREVAQGGYIEGYRNFFENNTDVLLNYQQQFGDNFSVQATAGGNLRSYTLKYAYGQTDYLVVPGVYNLSNTTNQLKPYSYLEQKQVISAYGSADLAFRNYLFLALTGRWDKSSTLPLNNNSYFYPSASLSAVLSDALHLPRAVSFLKVRGSFARVGGDLGGNPDADMRIDDARLVSNGATIYQNNPTYYSGITWNGNPTLYYPGTVYNQNLKPTFSTSYEGGLDIRFFENRLGVDVAHYNTFDGPSIFQLPVSEASGYDYRLENGLKYERRGWEVTVTGNPIRTDHFRWDVAANWSTYREYLRDIYPGVDKLPAAGGIGFVQVGERVDKYYNYDFERTPDGQVVVGDDGKPKRDNLPKLFGYYNPDWFGGITNTLSYKSLQMRFLFDGRVGGTILNYVNKKLWQSGRHPEAVAPERENDGLGIKSYVGEGMVITEGELVRDGNGNVISDTREFAPNTTAVFYQDWAKNYNGADAPNIIDKTYFKLREVVITYSFPSTLLQKTFVRNASVSLVARNLFYFSKYKNIDLDQYGTGYSSGLQTPSIKSYGINLTASF